MRHYVDDVEKLLAEDDQIYYGEHDGEDLSDWSEDQIWKELKDRTKVSQANIYSSVD